MKIDMIYHILLFINKQNPNQSF